MPRLFWNLLLAILFLNIVREMAPPPAKPVFDVILNIVYAFIALEFAAWIFEEMFRIKRKHPFSAFLDLVYRFIDEVAKEFRNVARDYRVGELHKHRRHFPHRFWYYYGYPHSKQSEPTSSSSKASTGVVTSQLARARRAVEGKVLNIAAKRKPASPLERRISVSGYICRAVLGYGGFGITLLCNDDIGNAYAIKIPRETFEAVAIGSTISIKNLDVVEQRFAKEAEIVKRLSYTHIVQLIDYGYKPFPYLVYEYLDGGSLRDVLEQSKLGLEDVVTAVLQISYALSYAYSQGIALHGDLKPENILFTRQGLLKVCDFNIARLAQSTSSSTSKGVLLGTPGYAAPEQLIYGLGKPSRKSDVFSIGILMYEMYTGENPLLGVHPSNYEDILRDLELRTGIKEIDELFLKMIKIRPELRPDIDYVIKILEEAYLAYITR